MISLCSALEIDPSEVTLAILSYYVKSPQMGVFKREDYINGWVAMGDVDTLEKQKKMMHKIKEDLLNDSAVRGIELKVKKLREVGVLLIEFMISFIVGGDRRDRNNWVSF